MGANDPDSGVHDAVQRRSQRVQSCSGDGARGSLGTRTATRHDVRVFSENFVVLTHDRESFVVLQGDVAILSAMGMGCCRCGRVSDGRTAGLCGV